MSELTISESLQLAQQKLRAGQAQEAEQICRRVLSDGPLAEALQLLSSALLKQSRRSEAADAIRELITLDPSSAGAYHNLGLVLTPIDSDGAIAAYRGSLALEPNSPEALNNLGDLLRQRGDVDEAANLLEAAVAVRSNFFQAQYNLALCRFQQEQHAVAETMLRTIIAAHPQLPDAYHTLGNVLRVLNRPDEALTAYSRALSLKPDFVEARWHASLALLTVGDFETGWNAHEARRYLKSVWRQPTFPAPEWRGEDLSGKRILLWTEQGFGDGIQFVRYASLVAERGGRVSVLCQPELKRLFKSNPSIARIFTSPEEATDYDLHAPLLSLPAIFKTRLDTVPADVPYLSADPAASQKWKDRLPAGRKIGLAWAGFGRERWITAGALNKLVEVPNVTYVSLQKTASDATVPQPSLPMLDFTAELRDFADTAALIDQLDLVVTCDTAVAHLAGAMGKPTWILLPFASPWRWMLDMTDTPWYPTVRLFRQSELGGWGPVIGAVVKQLQI